MLRDPNTNERICELCKKPLLTPHVRCDTKTCSPKCRQQAYRNRITTEANAARQARWDHAEKERTRKAKYNAARRKKRNTPKRRRSAKV